ncbi:uncharacterized protein LOC120092598 isoform X2 [Benincasa hispida]|uniref:uncharacterized protein LOC120092598 isoform X2 n=1 Tax=Benincasa hispida TaxID=102211 RepID=UPI00190054B4|nr:uncharacterized protein LOC120092598 isoform X2 [Benincasa hispida]
MGFFSFLGRVLFASLFILSAWQMFNEFGTDGGPAAKELLPKLNTFRRNVSARFGFDLPVVDVSHSVAAFLSLKGIGGLLFVFGSPIGAYLLLLYLAISTPILYDFYNYGREKSQFSTLLNDFILHVALAGALLFFIGTKNSISRRQQKKKAHKAKTN